MKSRTEELEETFSLPPMIAFRQPPNLKQMICKSKLHEIQKRIKRDTRNDGIGWKKCGKPCPICPFTFDKCKEIIGKASNYHHKINQNLTCQTENIIYYWTCQKKNCTDYPECEYIGESKRTFQDRFGEHRDYIKSENISQPAGAHFNKKAHSVSDIKGMVIEAVVSKDPFIRKERERQYIQKFKTFKKGLNQEP